MRLGQQFLAQQQLVALYAGPVISTAANLPGLWTHGMCNTVAGHVHQGGCVQYLYGCWACSRVVCATESRNCKKMAIAIQTAAMVPAEAFE
jgi:hypothetical protein